MCIIAADAVYKPRCGLATALTDVDCMSVSRHTNIGLHQVMIGKAYHLIQLIVKFYETFRKKIMD